jgi:hypothetical protein
VAVAVAQEVEVVVRGTQRLSLLVNARPILNAQGVVLGAVSVLLIKSKTYGLASIGLAMVATLMGGSKVEAITREPRAFSAGLDYFVLELLILGLLFIPMERLWSLHPDQKIFRTGWQTDLKHFFVSHAGVQLIAFATLIPVQVAFAWAVQFDFQKAVAAQPLPALVEKEGPHRPQRGELRRRRARPRWPDSIASCGTCGIKPA